MPAAIGSPALCNFVENNLRAIYEATTTKAFENAFDRFFSYELDVTVNGEASTRGSYKQQLWDESHRERSAFVNFLGLLAVPGDSEDLVRQNPLIQLPAILLLTATLTLSSKFSDRHRWCLPHCDDQLYAA